MSGFQIFFDSILVVDVTEPLLHQGTWFGNYRLLPSPEQGPMQNRLCEYVAFCEEWHDRLKQDLPYDSAEFDDFPEFIASTRWYRLDEQGNQHNLVGPPIFVEGEISWNEVDSPVYG